MNTEEIKRNIQNLLNHIWSTNGNPKEAYWECKGYISALRDAGLIRTEGYFMILDAMVDALDYREKKDAMINSLNNKEKKEKQ